MKKLLLCILLVGTLFFPTNVSAVEEQITSRMTSQKTPVDVSQVTGVDSLYTGYGQDPILYGDYLYTVQTGWGSTMPSLLRIDKETMEIVKKSDCIAQTGYTPYIASGDGKIFVPLVDGRVQAFDAETLESLWVSDNQGISENVATRLTYYDGYLYYGLGDYSKKNGDPFVALHVKDEDPSQQFETKNLVWSYNQGKGYYWSEAVIIDDVIAFAGYDGKIILHDLKTDKVYDEVDLGIGEITNSLFYDQNAKKIIVASRSGFIATLDIEGKDLKEETLKKSKDFNGQFSSSPVSYNGRIYIGGGYQTTFTVLDMKTLDVIYTIDDVAGQCAPILSTAYATDENNHEVQLYMINYAYDSNQNTKLYHIVDNALQKEPIYESMYTLDSSISNNYWNGNIIMDKDAFYAYNGNGTVVKFKFDTSIQTTKDEQAIVNSLNKEIAGLPEKTNVPTNLNSQLETIKSQYSKLSQEYKDKVTNMKKVTELENIIKEQKDIIKSLNENIVNQLNIYYISLDDETNVQNMIAQYQKIHTVNKDQVQNYQDVLDAQKIISQLKEGTIPTEVFENMIGEDIDYTISHRSNQNYAFRFTFNGMDLKTTKPFQFNVSNQSDLDDKIKLYTDNAFILDFQFQGEFPGKATFETETNLGDGNYVLYYFNERTNKIEFVQNVVVKDGKTSMELSHASTYFISKEIRENKQEEAYKELKEESESKTYVGVKTEDTSSIILPIVGVVVALIAIIFVVRKKK